MIGDIAHRINRFHGRPRRDQNDHYLIRFKAALDEDMAERAAAASLVIRLNLKAPQHIADGDDYLIRFSVLRQA